MKPTMVILDNVETEDAHVVVATVEHLCQQGQFSEVWEFLALALPLRGNREAIIEVASRFVFVLRSTL